MLKLKNMVLFNVQFSKSLKKLSRITLDDMQETIAMAKFLKSLSSHAQLFLTIKNNLTNEYVEKVEGEKVTLKDESKMEEFNQKLGELFEDEFETPLKKRIKMSEKLAKTLAPEDLIALEPILEY